MTRRRKVLEDSERLKAYDALTRKLSANCPLGNDPSPQKARRWKRAYGALFDVCAARRR